MARDFTRYVSVKEDPANDAVYAAVASKAVQAFTKISTGAEQASAAVNKIGKGTNAGDLSSSARAVVLYQEQVVRSAREAAEAERGQAAAARGGAAANDALAKSLRGAAEGFAIVQGPLGPVAGKLGAAARAVAQFSGLQVGLIGVGAALFGLAKSADVYTQLEARIRPFFDTQQQANGALSDVIGIAERSRSALAPIGDLYLRISNSAKEAGIDQQQVARATETIAKASALSGGPEETRNAGLFQLSQGLSRGVLQGNDLRLLEEDNIQVAKAIADGYKNADGTIGTTIGHLKELGETGELTAASIYAALDRSSGSVTEKFGKIPLTLNQATTQFKTAFDVFTGRLNETTGLTSGLATIVQSLANNLDKVTASAAAIGAAFLAPKLGGTIKDILVATEAWYRYRKALGDVQNVTVLNPTGIAAAKARTAAEVAQAEAAAKAEAAFNAQTAFDAKRNEAAAVRAAVENLRAQQAGEVGLTQTARAEAEKRVLNARETLASITQAQEENAAAAVEASRVRVAALREEALAARQAVLAAEQNVTSVQSAQVVTAADPNLSRASRNRILEQSDRALFLAESDLAAAQDASAAAAARLAAASDELALARRAARPDAEDLRATAALAAAQAELAASEEALVVAIENEKAVSSSDTVAALTAAEQQHSAALTEATAAEEARTAAAVEAQAAMKAEAAAVVEATEATDAAIAANRLFAGGLSSVIGLVFNWQTALVAASFVLVELLTHTSEADRLFQEHGQELDAIADKYDHLAAAAHNASKEMRQAALDQAQNDVNDAKREARTAVSDITRGLSGAAESLAPSTPFGGGVGASVARLQANPQRSALAEQLRADVGAIQRATDNGNTAAQLAALQKAESDYLHATALEPSLGDKTGFLGKLFGGHDTSDLRERVHKTVGAAGGVLDALKELSDAQAAINAPQTKPGAAPTLYSHDELDKRAALDADANAKALKQAADKRDAAYVALNHQFGYTDAQGKPDKGPTTEPQQQAYEAARAAIDKTYNAEVAAIGAARTARTAAHHEAIVQARDEQNAELATAKATKDAAIQQALLTTAPGTAERIAAIDAATAAYDKQVDAIRANGTASDTAAKQAIADQEAIATATEAFTQKRGSIADAYDDVPKAANKAANDIAYLQSQIGKVFNGLAAATDKNPLGAGVYTAEMAARDIANIQPVRRALDELTQQDQDDLRINELKAQGLDAQAYALSKLVPIYERNGSANEHDLALYRAKYQQLVEQYDEEERINDAIASRQRIAEAVQGTVDEARSATVSLITSLESGDSPKKAVSSFFKSAEQQLAKINATEITEKLFAGSDEKVRALLSGKQQAELASRDLASAIAGSATSTGRLTTAFDSATQAVTKFADAVTNAPAGGAGGTAGTGSTGSFLDLFNTPSTPAGTDDGITSALNSLADTQDDLVPAIKGLGNLGTFSASELPSIPNLSAPKGIFGTISDLFSTHSTATTPNGKDTLNAAFAPGLEKLGAGLDTTFNSIFGTHSTFFKGLGDSFGGALQGAGQGAIASGFAKALGIQQSKTGAQLGGAIGSFLPIPGGSIIGGLVGGTIGGLLKSSPHGASTVSVNQYGEATASSGFGNNSKAEAAAVGEATTVAQGLQQIAQQLGATITPVGTVTVGTYKGNYRVQTDGTHLGGKNHGEPDAVDFGKDGEQEAIQFAIKTMVEKGVISGISQASINIIKSGQDLDTAIQKAVAIESIPKQLEQLTDPVKYAVDQLNEQFQTLISDLKEGGASAEQFAQAQELYDKERASAIEQATQAATGSITDLIDSLTKTSTSPLNKQTVYENAKADYATLAAQVNAGQSVDGDKLATAAQTFEQASQAFNGSNTGFFADFNDVLAVLNKDKGLLSTSTSTGATLPASPFGTTTSTSSSDAIAASSTSTVSAINGQTTTLNGTLQQILTQLKSTPSTVVAAGAGGGTSGMSLLPGLRNSV